MSAEQDEDMEPRVYRRISGLCPVYRSAYYVQIRQCACVRTFAAKNLVRDVGPSRWFVALATRSDLHGYTTMTRLSDRLEAKFNRALGCVSCTAQLIIAKLINVFVVGLSSRGKPEVKDKQELGCASLLFC